MSFTNEDFVAIRSAVLDLASGTGRFPGGVIDHEPMSAPDGVGCVAAWISSTIAPILTSGLASVDLRLEAILRVMLPARAEPQGLIDAEVFGAASAVMEALCGHFSLGRVAGVRQIDIFGSDGEQLRLVSGYVQIDQTKFRVVDVYIPILINESFVLSE
jgi:hypothetical protein